MKKAIVTAVALLLSISTAAADPKLVIVAQSRTMIWNAVAVNKGTVYVAGPRWTGSQGPAIARLDAHGKLVPYPNAAWNAWHTGADPSHAFVNVNAIHLDANGALWAVDTGSPEFGGNPLPGGAKLVAIDLASGKVKRVIALSPDATLPGSYVDDVRFQGDIAYLTDAGRPGIIVLNLATGAMRRVLEDVPATTARDDRPIIIGGTILRGPDGQPLRVHADPMEVSPDGQWLYFGTLEGPWSRIATKWLDDFTVSPKVIAAEVQPWADLPPVGGTAMDANGDLYFSDLAAYALKRRSADSQVTTIIQDPKLDWIDAPVIDTQHRIWLPVPQLDRAAIFHNGQSQVQWPVMLYRL
ncbi:MAG TPA: L-dopachrome tautomerase-related protein, partial [Terriglobales bacterium]|nr:L-dopachrome tautomerase-related protein [Terriglobales bacterium]